MRVNDLLVLYAIADLILALLTAKRDCGIFHCHVPLFMSPNISSQEIEPEFDSISSPEISSRSFSVAYEPATVVLYAAAYLMPFDRRELLI